MMLLAVTALLLAPWKGADLPTSTVSAIKYRLTIKDAPGADVHLRATRVAAGWIAAFCDNRVCSPSAVRETMPSSGTMMLQFELIREADNAPRKTGARIEADGGAVLSIPVSKL